MGCHGIIWILIAIWIDEDWMSELRRNFHRWVVWFFFLWEKVVIVKYKLLFLRSLYFTFLKYFRNSQSSAEGNIYSVTSWGTLILNEWCLDSDLFWKGQWKDSQFTFLILLVSDPITYWLFYIFLIISNSDFFHCRMFYVKYVCVICFKI